MKNFVLFIVLLQILNLAVSVTVKPKNGEAVVLFDKGADFSLTCEAENVLNEVIAVSWKKDNKTLEAKLSKVAFESSTSNYSVNIKSGVDDDAGYYSCIFSINGKDQDTVTILAATSKIRVETQDNLNVVEGEKLRLICKTYGRPTPNITWHIGNVTYKESSGNVELKDEGVPNAVLTIENVNITNMGSYKCIGHSDILNITDEDITLVTIKDKYAALWPFLGICVEVFVLCAIILIYEKKRNKTEMEESDTDQSPDQKNTPDHGKETNLRHRQ